MLLQQLADLWATYENLCMQYADGGGRAGGSDHSSMFQTRSRKVCVYAGKQKGAVPLIHNL